MLKIIKNSNLKVLFLLLLINGMLNASYHSIYYMKNNNFSYLIENGKYVVYTKNPEFISYERNGFKLFLPYFLTNYNLEILRVGSIGYIHGYLSNKKNNYHPIIYKSYSDSDYLDYYKTDYKSNKKQLTYLLNGYVIPYTNSTSLVIEGENIPLYISNKLNKWFYFSLLIW